MQKPYPKRVHFICSERGKSPQELSFRLQATSHPVTLNAPCLLCYLTYYNIDIRKHKRLYKFAAEINTTDMLNVFLRAIILYLFLLLAMRLMGKRQLSEFQPFEFAITLVAADLACIPMADNTIPIIYGIIPILTLVILHNLLTFLSVKSQRFRKVINGKPVILIDNGVIDTSLLKKCGMTANDLLESLREQGYFKIGEIAYAVLETNGKVSVLQKFANAPVTNADMNVSGGTNELPANIIVEGKFMGETLGTVTPPIGKLQILKTLKAQNIEQKNVFLFSLADNEAFIHTYDGKVLNTILESE